MARYTEPKCRLCRREGEKLFLKGEKCVSQKCPMLKRSYPPGMHGNKGMRLSEYGKELRAKQKLKRIYGVYERQFRKYFNEASKVRGVTGTMLLQSLERRLDNAVYRAGFAESRSKARQLVAHGSLQVNGKSVNIPSFRVSINDEISVKESKTKKNYFKLLSKSLSSKNLPGWLSLDVKGITFKIVALPEKKDVDLGVDVGLVVELYSR